MTDSKLVVKGCLGAGVLALALVGCEDKPKETKTESADAAAAQQAGVDPNLAKAVAAAGSKSRDAGPAAQGDGPPQTGVFDPGKADDQLKKGAPPKIVLGQAGTEPRVSLAANVPPSFKQPGQLEISLKLGRASLPPIGVSLDIEAAKPKAPPAAPGAAPAPAPAPTPGEGTPMSAKISDVKLKGGDLGADGRELAGQLAKMRGSRIDFRLVNGGVGVDYDYQLAKGAPPELDMVLRAVSEALEASTLGYPSEPVGAGGFWLITTRGTVSGTEVISYRLVKLTAVNGNELTLSVNTKRYATSTKLDLPGVPPGAELDQFQSTSDATLIAQKGSPFATSGTAKQTFLAALMPAGGQQDQRLAVQSAADVTLAFGKK